MKKILYLILVSVVVLTTGCNKKEIARLQAQRDSLLAVGSSKDASLVEFVDAFNEIQANLDTIKQKEMVIDNTAKGTMEVKGSKKEQIQSDINYIYNLLQKNRELVAQLSDKLKKSNKQTAELQKMIENLNKMISEKDAQIAQLTDELGRMNIKVQDLTREVGSLNTSVSNLTTETQQKQQVIEEKTTQLNTAYYVIGTTRELKDKNIITKEGGFIGIGRSKDLKDQLDLSYFTRVDITKVNVIPIMKNKVAIISSHPANSYKITGENTADSLVITNSNEFWSVSKVLVINVK